MNILGLHVDGEGEGKGEGDKHYTDVEGNYGSTRVSYNIYKRV